MVLMIVQPTCGSVVGRIKLVNSGFLLLILDFLAFLLCLEFLKFLVFLIFVEFFFLPSVFIFLLMYFKTCVSLRLIISVKIVKWFNFLENSVKSSIFMMFSVFLLFLLLLLLLLFLLFFLFLLYFLLFLMFLLFGLTL